jgi:hypothetical protein
MGSRPFSVSPQSPCGIELDFRLAACSTLLRRHSRCVTQCSILRTTAALGYALDSPCQHSWCVASFSILRPATVAARYRAQFSVPPQRVAMCPNLRVITVAACYRTRFSVPPQSMCDDESEVYYAQLMYLVWRSWGTVRSSSAN